MSPEESSGKAFGIEVQVFLDVFLGDLDVEVGDLGLGDDGRIRTGGDDDSEFHQLLDGGKTKLVVLDKTIGQDCLRYFGESSFIGVEPE